MREATSDTKLNGAFGTAISSDGQYVYVAASAANRVTIVDVSNPRNTNIVGSVTASSLNTCVDVVVSPSGKYVYAVSFTSSKVTTIDVSDPTNPTVVVTSASNDALSSALALALVPSGLSAVVSTDHGVAVYEVCTATVTEPSTTLVTTTSAPATTTGALPPTTTKTTTEVGSDAARAASCSISALLCIIAQAVVFRR